MRNLIYSLLICEKRGCTFIITNPLGIINENQLVLHFLLEIYIQLEQKCQSELVEDIKKDTFRQAQCDNLI